MALLAACCAASSAAAADHITLFKQGKRAADFRRWREALAFFDEAARVRPREGGRVREAGSFWRAYLPRFYSGLALYELGRYDDALEVWKDSEQQGVIRDEEEFEKLLELRWRYVDTIFPQAARSAEARIEVARATVASARERLARARAEGLDVGQLEAVLQRAEERLLLAEERLKSARAGMRHALIEEAIALAEQVEDETKHAIGEYDGRIASAEQAEARAAAARAFLNDYLRTSELLEKGGCRKEAVPAFEALVARSRALDLRSLRPAPAPRLQLARAHLECGELARASLYLDLAEYRHEGTEESRRALQTRLESHRRQRPPTGTRIETREELEWEGALGEYLRASVVAEADVCSPEAIEILERSNRVLGTPAARMRPPSVGSAPLLALARAHRSCGSREEASARLQEARRAGQGQTSEAARLEEWLRETAPAKLYANSHALVVGASRYEKWGPLPGVEDDIQEVRKVLEAHGFDVPPPLMNPTKKQLEDAIAEFVKGPGSVPENRVLFYFAGHGATVNIHIEKVNRAELSGYIVPVDAPRKDDDHPTAFMQRATSMERFEGWAKDIAAKHALFIFDSCFAGTIFSALRGESRGARPVDELRPPGSTPPYVEESVKHPVRMFVAAGTESQTVPDKSIFREFLVQALQGEADEDADRYLTGTELGHYLWKNVSNRSNNAQTPEYGPIKDRALNRGNFIFRIPAPAQRVDPVRLEDFAWPDDVVAWKSADARGTREAYQNYLGVFPSGRFAPLAQIKVARLDREAPRP